MYLTKAKKKKQVIKKMNKAVYVTILSLFPLLKLSAHSMTNIDPLVMIFITIVQLAMITVILHSMLDHSTGTQHSIIKKGNWLDPF